MVLRAVAGPPGRLLGLALVTKSFWGLIACQVPLMAASYLANLAITSSLTASVPAEEVGTVLGVDMATYSLAGAIAPLASAFFYNHGTNGLHAILGVSGSAYIFLQCSLCFVHTDTIGVRTPIRTQNIE